MITLIIGCLRVEQILARGITMKVERYLRSRLVEELVEMGSWFDWESKRGS